MNVRKEFKRRKRERLSAQDIKRYADPDRIPMDGQAGMRLGSWLES